VRAQTLDPAELPAALKAGRYYASTGPELRGIRLHDGVLTVHCSPASKVLVTGRPGSAGGAGRRADGALAVAVHVRAQEQLLPGYGGRRGRRSRLEQSDSAGVRDGRE
jgi:hypothetical protein